MILNSELEVLYEAIDKLSPEQFIQLRQYVENRAHSVLYVLSHDHLKTLDEIFAPIQAETSTMTDEEINTLIDEAIAEVRYERENQSSD